MLSEAYLYESHHSLQIRDTLSFLESTVRKMDWTRQEQDVVMDIGCGPGGSCRSIFLPCFPGVRKVIAIDVLKDMIAFAQLNNSDDRIEYHVADIEDRQTIEKWSQQLSKVVSTFCFHWLRDMERGFSNIYFLLKPGGEAALLFTASASAWDSYELLYRNPKWSRYLQEETMLSDAKLYSVHRSMQIHDTEIFLESVVRKMDWSRPEQDIVMDIGCGPGNSCRKMLLPAFPKVRKVVAVDVLPDMIEFAKKNNADEKIEYHVADIEDRNSMEKWSGQISKALSIYCFNWLGNHREAFSNIYRVLKPGGEAALLFVISTPFWDSYELHYKSPKWSKYLQNINPHVPESHFKKHGASFYRDLLRDIGFNVVICEDEERTYTYPDDDDCRAASYSRSALTSYIPDELKAEFKEDVFQGFLKYNGRSSDGRPMLKYTTLTLLVQKPN